MADTFVRFDPAAMRDAGGDLVFMTPDQYLQLSPPMKGNPVKDAKGRELRASVLDRGDAIENIPSLKISVEEGGKGKVMGQDGRHRAELAKEQGIKLIPVRVEKKGDGEISSVVSMRGEELPWDVKRPKKWSQIADSPDFKALPPEKKRQVHDRYFDEVVAPTVPEKQGRALKSAWSSTYEAGPAIPKSKTADEFRKEAVDEMSGFDRVRAGYGKSVVDTFSRGPQSLIGTMSPAELRETRRLDAPLMRTGAGGAGNVAGNVINFLPVGMVPGANTVVGAAGLGALTEFLQPAENMSERMHHAEVGGIVSGGVTAAARALPSVWKAFVEPFRESGQERIALDQIKRFARDPAAIAALNPANLQKVPGSVPSLAEATGDPGIAQLQRAAQAKMPDVASAFADARSARLTARKDALAKIAGEEGDKGFLEAARDSAANRLYTKAFSAPVDPTKLPADVKKDLAALLDRPSMKKAFDDSFLLAQEEGQPLKEGASDFVRRLHFAKKSLDRQIDQAMGKEGAIPPDAIIKTRDKLLDVIDRVSPDYKAARATYKADSAPITRMEIGGYLRDKLLPALNDFGTERYRPEQFAKALREGDQMAKKATGFKGARLSDILTGTEIEELKGVAEDLGREAQATEAGRVAGSPTAQYLAGANMLRQIAGPLGLPESWVDATLGRTVSHWLSVPAKVSEQGIEAKLARFLVDPMSAAAAARRAQARELGPMVAGQRIPLSRIGEVALPPASVGAGAYANQE